MAKLYAKPLYENLDDDNESATQSYDEFLEIGQRPPNEFGTGRFIVGDDNRRTIHLLYLKGSTVDNKLAEFISAYFGLPVTTTVTELSMMATGKSKTKKRSFADISQDISFPLKYYKPGNSTDVFSIFDVLVEFLPPGAFSSVLLVDFPISEDKEVVYGRACGDRVAVVSSDSITTRRDHILVVIHELLHTFGFDHCDAFACIMNPASSETNTLELCPAELRKLLDAVRGIDLVKRWRDLERLCRAEGWASDADWFAQRLQLTDSVSNSSVALPIPAATTRMT